MTVAQQEQTQNVMRTIKVAKVTINIGCGTDAKKMERGQKLIQQLTGLEPVKAKTTKRLASWGLRPGLPIGVKITLRGKQAVDLLERCIQAKERRLKPSTFDNNGNVSFGIAEYIDIPQAQYDPNIGIMGLQVSVTLERPGTRVKKRARKIARIPQRHRISKQDAIAFMAEKFKVQVE